MSFQEGVQTAVALPAAVAISPISFWIFKYTIFLFTSPTIGLPVLVDRLSSWLSSVKSLVASIQFSDPKTKKDVEENLNKCNEKIEDAKHNTDNSSFDWDGWYDFLIQQLDGIADILVPVSVVPSPASPGVVALLGSLRFAAFFLRACKKSVTHLRRVVNYATPKSKL